MNTEPLPIQPIDSCGYSWEQVSNMARLGLVLEGFDSAESGGEVDNIICFEFIVDSPLGRANQIAEKLGYDLLATCVKDARDLDHEDFKVKYPSLAPFAE